MLAMYLAVLDDRSSEEQFIDVYNTYKRLVYHTAYKIMGDSYLAEDVLQEVFLYVAKNFSKIHRENCHELAAYLVSCSRSRAYDMLRKQREEPLEEVPDAPDDAPVPDDAVVSTDNIQHLTELIGQMKPMYRDPLRLLAMGYTNREIAESLGLTDEVVRIVYVEKAFLVHHSFSGDAPEPCMLRFSCGAVRSVYWRQHRQRFNLSDLLSG